MVISVTGINSSDFIPPTPTSLEGDNSVLDDKYSLKRTFDSVDDIGHVSITIVRAENLAAADLGGKSDPFAVVELGNAMAISSERRSHKR